MISQSLPWTDPLSLAAGIEDDCWALLYSGVRTSYTGRYSYLGCQLAERVEGDDFSSCAERLHNSPKHASPFSQRWFTLFGYGLKNSLEVLPHDAAGWFGLPNLVMLRFHTLFVFDHELKTLTRYSDLESPPSHTDIPHEGYIAPEVKSFTSPMSDAEYLYNARQIIASIHAGDLYQANLTRKYQGSLTSQPNHFSLFRELCHNSPAAYSAYIRLGERHILSSSPEQFLSITPGGYITSRPIKGTAPRSASVSEDNKAAQELSTSPKDRAENLMITDLMRNDLARSCVPGSIKVDDLFEITSHAHIHHMSSTVSGQIEANISSLEAIAACFPPGSMTGAPKIHAMKLCSQLEQLERGLYSGAIGWLDASDGSCELSVVIRTLFMNGTAFEFQVGGGIVADSTPEGELQEIIVKSKAIIQTLGIRPEMLHIPQRCLSNALGA